MFEGKKILIAEDSWHIAHALKIMVEGEGAEVLGPVPTVSRACRLLDESEIDLALVDFNLRDETAFPLIEALIARGVKCIVLSGYRNLGGLDGSVVAVLGKPVQPEVLLRAVGQALSETPSRESGTARSHARRDYATGRAPASQGDTASHVALHLRKQGR